MLLEWHRLSFAASGIRKGGTGPTEPRLRRPTVEGPNHTMQIPLLARQGDKLKDAKLKVHSHGEQHHRKP
jgi:hypothetical protein